MEHDALSEDGTEEVVCRICRMPDSEEEGKLYYPCNCKGSIKHVHQDCLNRWLTHSGHRHCELCKHEFSFTPVYREDAPMRLTWLELLSGLANKSATGLHFGLRLALVLLVWLVAVPLTTCWLWRLAFVRSFPHAVATISQRLKLIYLLSDCVQGSIISSILIFLVLVSTYVWDYVRMTYWQGRRRGRRVVQGAQRVPRRDRPVPGVEDLAPVQEGPGRGVAGPDAWYLDRQRGVPALLRQQAEMQRERDAFRREHQALLDEAQALVDIAGGSAPQSAEDISLRQQQVQRISDRLAAARADPRFDSIAMEPYNFTGAGVGLAQRGTQLSPGQTTAAGRLLGTVADRNGAVDATTDTDSGSGSDSGNEPGDQGSEALSAPGDEPLEPHRGSDYLYPAQPITTNKRSKGLLRSPSAAASEMPDASHPHPTAVGPRGGNANPQEAPSFLLAEASADAAGAANVHAAQASASVSAAHAWTVAQPSSSQANGTGGQRLPTQGIGGLRSQLQAAFSAPEALAGSSGGILSAGCGTDAAEQAASSSSSSERQPNLASLCSSQGTGTLQGSMAAGSSASGAQPPSLHTLWDDQLNLGTRTSSGGFAAPSRSQPMAMRTIAHRRQGPNVVCGAPQALPFPPSPASPGPRPSGSDDETSERSAGKRVSQPDPVQAAERLAAAAPATAQPLPEPELGGFAMGLSGSSSANAAHACADCSAPAEASTISPSPAELPAVEPVWFVMGCSEGSDSGTAQVSPSGSKAQRGRVLKAVRRRSGNKAHLSGSAGQQQPPAADLDHAASHAQDEVAAASDAPAIASDGNSHEAAAIATPLQPALPTEPAPPAFPEPAAAAADAADAGGGEGGAGWEVAPPALQNDLALVPQGQPAPPAVHADHAEPDGREIPLEELVGLQGPVRSLFENAATVLFSSFALLVMVLWLPFMTGRAMFVLLALAQMQLRFTILPQQLLQALLDLPPPAQNHSFFSSSSSSSGNGSADSMSSTFALPEQTANQAAAELGLPEEPMFLHLHFNLARVSLDRLASAFDVVLSGPRLADWACLLFGYTLLAGTAVAACWAVYIHKVMRQRRRQRQAAPASHTDDLFETGAAIVMDAWKQLCRSAAQLAVCTKVLCIMSLEIAILPVVYGVWVDICALRLLDASLVGRLAFFQRAPMSFLLLHWLLGMGILMTVAGFLSVLRNMIRPGALPWLRDPYEEEDALQQMMTMPFTMQAQREAAALLTMSLLAVVLVHIPVRLARTLAPGLYPLHFHVVDAFSEVPADMLLFHVCIPFTVPHLHIRATFRRCMMWWLRNASKLVGVDQYLLPPPAAEAARPANAAGAAGPANAAAAAGPPVPLPLVLAQAPAAPAVTPDNRPSAEAAGPAEREATEAQHAQQAEHADATASQKGDSAQHFPAPTCAIVGSQPQAAESQLVTPAMAAGAAALARQQAVAAAAQPGSHGQAGAGCEVEQAVGTSGMMAQARGRAQTSMQQAGFPGAGAETATEGTSAGAAASVDQPGDSRAGPSSSGYPGPSAGEASNIATAPVGTHQPGINPGNAQPNMAQQPTQPAAATTGHVMGIDGVDDELAGRLLLLGMLLLASVIGCSTLMLTVPVTTGHAIFKLLRLPVRHDLYSTAMGLYALWGLATAAQRVCQLAQAGNSRTCLRVVTKWLRLWAKVAVLVLLSVVVLPLMVGVFIELLAMPLRLRVNESPLLFIYQDWGLGLLILKLWYRAVVSFGADNNRNAPAARPGSWRARFAVFQQQGVTGIGFGFAMTQILWPLLLGVGVLLALPYVVTRGLLPLLPLSAEALQYAFMYGFAAELAILVLGYALLQLQRALSALHNTIRDERYLVGRELNNLATRSEQCLPPARESVSYARR